MEGFWEFMRDIMILLAKILGVLCLIQGALIFFGSPHQIPIIYEIMRHVESFLVEVGFTLFKEF